MTRNAVIKYGVYPQPQFPRAFRPQETLRALRTVDPEVFPIEVPVSLLVFRGLPDKEGVNIEMG